MIFVALKDAIGDSTPNSFDDATAGEVVVSPVVVLRKQSRRTPDLVSVAGDVKSQQPPTAYLGLCQTYA